MGVIIEENKILIITEPKTTQFDLPKHVGTILKHETDFIIKHNKF